MAFLGPLLTALGKKLGDILQAIFGWSITALFGRLPRKKQLAVSGALVVSLAWPIFVVGLFLPGIASWVLAFLPLERWMGPSALRIVWACLAIASPLIVGGLVRWAAPAPKTSVMVAVLYGYPLAVAFFGAFVITAVTVPIVKLASIVRGWSEEHVYMQPREGGYERALASLVEACERAGVPVVVESVPTRLVLATEVMKRIGRRVARPMMGTELRRVRGRGIELYLYPSDLLVRGRPQRAAAVRAMLTLTGIEQSAFLVGSSAGQCIQEEIGRLSAIVAEHEEHHHRVGSTAKSRLADIWQEMKSAQLPFEEWAILETLIRRLERRLVRQRVGSEVFVIEPREAATPHGALPAPA